MWISPCTQIRFLCVGAVNTFWLVIILSLHEHSPHYAFPAPTKCIIKNKHLSAFQTISLPLISTARQKEHSLCVYVKHCSVVQQLVHRWMSVALINSRPRAIDCSLLWFDVCDGWAASSCEGGCATGWDHRHQQEWRPHRETGRNEEMEDICQLGRLRGPDCLTGEWMGWWC